MLKNLTIKKIVLASFSLIALLFILFNIGNLWEDVSAGEIVVIQDPIDGELHVYTTPGMVSQNLGTATHYKKSAQLWFTKLLEDGKPVDQSIKVRFNDG